MAAVRGLESQHRFAHQGEEPGKRANGNNEGLLRGESIFPRLAVFSVKGGGKPASTNIFQKIFSFVDAAPALMQVYFHNPDITLGKHGIITSSFPTDALVQGVLKGMINAA
jgi:hypothetical protein